MQLSRSYGTSQINSAAMKISEEKNPCLISTLYLFENTEQNIEDILQQNVTCYLINDHSAKNKFHIMKYYFFKMLINVYFNIWLRSMYVNFLEELPDELFSKLVNLRWL